MPFGYKLEFGMLLNPEFLITIKKQSMQLIDSHCHLDFKIFDTDREALLVDASQHYVTKIIVPSVARANWQSVSEIRNNYDITAVAYGLHPMFMKQHQLSDLLVLREYLENNKPIAVGECGLDFFIKDANKEAQVEFFTEQLKLANEFELPVIVHARKSLDIVLKAIRKFPNIRGVIHSFSGSRQQAETCIKQGFMLGFGGPITYTRATKLRKLVSELPLESLLLETDAPDQPDSSHYGQRNVPANLLGIAKEVAELRACELSEVAQITSQNAKQLFNLPNLPIIDIIDKKK